MIAPSDPVPRAVPGSLLWRVACDVRCVLDDKSALHVIRYWIGWTNSNNSAKCNSPPQCRAIGGLLHLTIRLSRERFVQTSSTLSISLPHCLAAHGCRRGSVRHASMGTNSSALKTKSSFDSSFREKSVSIDPATPSARKTLTSCAGNRDPGRTATSRCASKTCIAPRTRLWLIS